MNHSATTFLLSSQWSRAWSFYTPSVHTYFLFLFLTQFFLIYSISSTLSFSNLFSPLFLTFFTSVKHRHTSPLFLCIKYPRTTFKTSLSSCDRHHFFHGHHRHHTHLLSFLLVIKWSFNFNLFFTLLDANSFLLFFLLRWSKSHFIIYSFFTYLLPRTVHTHTLTYLLIINDSKL